MAVDIVNQPGSKVADNTVERRLRRFLLIIVELLCLGTMAELVLAKHYKETDQLIPFALCIVGFSIVLMVQFRPGRRTIWVMRIIMAMLVLGSLLGGYLHLSTNYAFAKDIRPNSTATDALLTALSGTAPLLAPGILALADILALAATYYLPRWLRSTLSNVLQLQPRTFPSAHLGK